MESGHDSSSLTASSRRRARPSPQSTVRPTALRPLRPRRRAEPLALGLASLIAVAAAWASDADLAHKSPSDFADLSLEELSNIRVTSVSKKKEKLSEAAAAITVITQDDIRRSGATSIPEALRLAPGLDVAQVDAHDWAISSRGFNDLFANKLLVLMDGRSVYTPLFSGVFWDQQDTLLEDLDRIEVIRGPGASLWGANAVDGVINIITKSAKETQGTLLEGGAGSEDLGFGGFRYGGKLSDDVYYRVYGKYYNRSDYVLPSGMDANDASQAGQGGFRMDWDVSANTQLTFQGDAYDGLINDTYTVPQLTVAPTYQSALPDQGTIRGGNLLGRLTHTFSEDSDLKLQVYYDRYARDVAIFQDDQQTFDLDFQHRFPLGQRQDILWGLGYRLMADNVGNSPAVALYPTDRRLQLFSAFLQDEILLVEDRLHLTLGSKFEHNDFTGFEIQPSARLAWTPAERHTFWTSVSRAVRTPSRAEEGLVLNQGILPPGTMGSPVPIVESVYGDGNFLSEEELAYEIGYRFQPIDQVSFDLSLYYNDYQHLRSIEPGIPVLDLTSGPPHLVAPFTGANNLKGNTYGAELGVNWQVERWWQLRGSYTFLEMNLQRGPGSLDYTSLLDTGKSPRHQFMLRSSMDLPAHLELDQELRYVDSLPTLGVPSYVEMDVRLAWHARPNLEVSIVGQNLLHSQHLEFTPTFINTQTIEIQRGVYGQITWHF